MSTIARRANCHRFVFRMGSQHHHAVRDGLALPEIPEPHQQRIGDFLAASDHQQRDFTDVVVFIVIGGVLLALLPAKREAVASGVA
jgi:hypothetical protein